MGESGSGKTTIGRAIVRINPITKGEILFKGEKLPAIDGTPPNLFNKIKGDAFAPRNRYALNIDYIEEPPMYEVTATHNVKAST